jgi:hypothetical protein
MPVELQPQIETAQSRERIVGAELGDYFGRGGAGQIALVGWKRDGAYTRVSPSSVAFANLRQVDHLLGLGFGPWVRTDGNLGAETGFA